MKTLIALATLALLTGCAASTPDEARSMGDDRRVVFTVPDGYQAVYRRMVEIQRRCYQANLITASMIVNADLYPDTRSGQITVGLYGIAVQIHQVIDIQGLDDGTRVTAIFPLGNVRKQGERVNGWANGTRTDC